MRIILLLVALFLATNALAQDAERVEAAQTYVNSKGQQTLMDDMLSPEGVMAQMGLLDGRVPEEKQQILAMIVSEELASIRPVMEDAMINGMAQNFTLEEIEAMAEFYSSDVGASAMRKMNPFMAQTMQQIGSQFQEMQANLARRIQQEMSQ